MANPVVHFEVMGKDGAALQAFYTQAFGWELLSEMPGYAMVHPGGEGGIDGGIGTSPEPNHSHVTFYVQADDLAASLSTVERLGGHTEMPPDQVPGGPMIALFTDPEGHLVGLLEAGSMGG